MLNIFYNFINFAQRYYRDKSEIRRESNVSGI